MTTARQAYLKHWRSEHVEHRRAYHRNYMRRRRLQAKLNPIETKLRQVVGAN